MKHFIRIDLTAEEVRVALLEYCRDHSSSLSPTSEPMGLTVWLKDTVVRPLSVIEGARVEFEQEK